MARIKAKKPPNKHSIPDVTGISVDEIDTHDVNGFSLYTNIALMKVAGTQSKRVNRLDAIVEKLESKIFDENKFEKMSNEQSVRLYDIASRNLDTASKNVMNLLKSIDWETIQEQILELSQEAESPDTFQLDDTKKAEMARQAFKFLAESTKASPEDAGPSFEFSDGRKATPKTKPRSRVKLLDKKP
jgi:hypothetical protein